MVGWVRCATRVEGDGGREGGDVWHVMRGENQDHPFCPLHRSLADSLLSFMANPPALLISVDKVVATPICYRLAQSFFPLKPCS